MRDETGNRIDLDFVDAIGRLADGRFDVWMQDGTRTVTTELFAYEKWRNHIRLRSYATLRPSRPLTPADRDERRNMMSRFRASEKNNNATSILNQLAMQDSESRRYLITNTREEYDLLVREAFNGRLQDTITLSRSGIRLNKKQVIPPESRLCDFADEGLAQYA